MNIDRAIAILAETGWRVFGALSITAFAVGAVALTTEAVVWLIQWALDWKRR